MSGGAFNSVSDLGPRDSRYYLVRRRFVNTIGFCLGCFNRILGSVAGLKCCSRSLAAVASQVAIDGLAVAGLAVADFDLTRG